MNDTKRMTRAEKAEVLKNIDADDLGWPASNSNGTLEALIYPIEPKTPYGGSFGLNGRIIYFLENKKGKVNVYTINGRTRKIFATLNKRPSIPFEKAFGPY